MKREWMIEPPPKPRPIRGYTFDEATITVSAVRRWPDDKLHVLSASQHLGAPARSMVEAEKRRREAWRAPAGAAFWISCVALVVSVGSLIVAALEH